MILVIDTSSAMAALATIDDVTGRREEVFIPTRDPEFLPTLRRLARPDVTRVAVATGPGSFTGLRVGVSFGLGLAMGRRIGIVPLPSLELQAARSDEPVIAVSDAGRGRFYHRLPGGITRLGEAGEIPTTHPLVGRLPTGAEQILLGTGHVFKAERELRSFVDAAAKMLAEAGEVPYGSLEIEYMQAFSPSRK